MDQTWRPRLQRELLRRIWDGEAVVYDTIAGSTHYLDSVSAAVLDCLDAGRTQEEEVLGVLLTEFGADSEADVLAAMRDALAKLQEMGLIQPADL